MTHIDSMPDQEELNRRRKPIPIIDPKHVTPKDDLRVRQWGLSIMQKHESRLKNNTPSGTVVFQKEVEPEEIDIRNIYPFPDLYYFIMKQGNQWVLRLCSTKTTDGKGVILAQLTYAKI